MNEYDQYIARCKAPKSLGTVKRIIQHIIIGAKRGWDNTTLAAKLNEHRIYSLVNKKWTVNNLQMAVLNMVRFESDSSMAYALAAMLRTGEATPDDLVLLKSRTRLAA